ncbi:hypothetical protein LAC81_10250 [Ensifer adhaerens]|uniref:hypothetical protein n=1 Tax=Ensifer adhaerens TaxID=106592 RepID=UPI001CC137AD|nr:hypothetical protein [Ensifer adhaerens]MBZ7922167.1 hypothetical protein [Ensifer adhaerens]UAX94547.1 hypothetical protein LAC78_10245 [Ensifer adhaerens]UAY02181.1 hypothetical protein LAC80_10255 [Ensifer adhaerens]UAY09564.1 hypothetical protein LAC81_10250 [Ensifer adhaerens]
MFRELDLKWAYGGDREWGAEFDFDGDVGPELPVRDGVSFLLQLDIGMKEESWAECFSVLVVTRTKGPAEARTRATWKYRATVSQSLGIMRTGRLRLASVTPGMRA